MKSIKYNITVCPLELSPDGCVFAFLFSISSVSLTHVTPSISNAALSAVPAPLVSVKDACSFEPFSKSFSMSPIPFNKYEQKWWIYYQFHLISIVFRMKKGHLKEITFKWKNKQRAWAAQDDISESYGKDIALKWSIWHTYNR